MCHNLLVRKQVIAYKAAWRNNAGEKCGLARRRQSPIPKITYGKEIQNRNVESKEVQSKFNEEESC